MNKQQLRRKYLSKRTALAPEVGKRLSAEICQRMIRESWFISADQLLMYMPFRQEVDIRPLMEVAWGEGKTVYLPKSDPATNSMRVYQVNALHELQPGTYGILEPVADDNREGDIAELDIVLIPGVVFDRHGYRIGYGGGYYDRFLPRLESEATLIGVAFSLQVVERIPHDSYDQPLHVLVTERETVTFRT